MPEGIQSLGIPTFQNLTSQYRIEQIISSAVLKEFSLRTKIPVNSSSAGVDSVLLGEIVNISSTPVTFGTQTVGSQTYGATFMISVQISAKLVRLKDSAVLWQNDNFLYREPYILNANVSDFFSEENPCSRTACAAFRCKSRKHSPGPVDALRIQSLEESGKQPAQ